MGIMDDLPDYCEAHRWHKTHQGIESWYTPHGDLEYVDEIDDVPSVAISASADSASAYVWADTSGTIYVAFFSGDDKPGELWTGSFWCDIDGYCYGEMPEDDLDD